MEAPHQVKRTAGARGEALVIFCRLSEPNPWFSNWYKAAFAVEGVLFSCVEQHMMWSKAKYMLDEESARRVLASDSPKEIKELGRKVKNYDDALWQRVREDVVYVGNLAKYKQHADLRRALLDTAGATLVEAAAYDRVWGVGLGSKNKLILDKNNWQGENLLGKVLMRVRAELGQ